MRGIKFRAWFMPEKKMYFRAYQKFFHVLLCDPEGDDEQSPGRPVRRASYGDCELLEGTGILDASGREIFEGDIVEIHWQDRVIRDCVGPVPDMYRSRGLHPLADLLKRHGIPADASFTPRLLGNRFENPSLLS